MEGSDGAVTAASASRTLSYARGEAWAHSFGPVGRSDAAPFTRAAHTHRVHTSPAGDTKQQFVIVEGVALQHLYEHPHAKVKLGLTRSDPLAAL